MCWVFSSSAITGPVTPKRICLNNNDSIVTLDWLNPTDACLSFSLHRLYAREGVNPFVPIAEIKNNVTTSYQYKLPNLNPSWQFYWVTLYSCNGIDSFTSVIFSIDQNKPAIMQLDSVSIDLTTQKLTAGWQPNIATDTKGYRIYQYNSGINDSIADTSSTYYLFYNSNNLNRDITFATYDSCNLYSPISNPHRAINLSGTIDTCQNSISLNWTNYIGWSTIRFDLYIQTNKGPWSVYRSATPSEFSDLFKNFTLGDSVCFFVRAWSNSASSSSNTICFYTRAKEIPTKNYIEDVTVNNNTSLDISWSGSGLSDVKQIVLVKNTNGSAFSNANTFANTSTFLFQDIAVNVHQDIYGYQVLLKDVCGAVLSNSNISFNILLQLNNTDLNWSPYVGWSGSVDFYSLYSGLGSTWNNSSFGSPTIYTLSASEQDAAKTCFYITCQEVNNTFNKNALSVSNTVCYEGPFSFYVPNVIVPHGINNKFSVQGVNIDTTLSNYKIFNRWGEILLESKSIFDPWYADYLGEPVQPGIYFYVIDIFSNKGERQSKKGEIRIIK